MQAIERTFDILEAISTHNGNIGVNRLADKLGYSKSTISRFVSALEKKGMVTRSADQKLSIGPGIYQLTRQDRSQDRLIQIAEPILKRLNLQTGEAVGLSILNGAEIEYIFDLPSLNVIQVIDWTRQKAPLHLTLSGKLFLSQFSEPEFKRYTGRPLTVATQHSIVSTDTLIREIKEVAQQGYAQSDEEFSLDTFGYAVPISASDGDQNFIAAITVYGPKFRIETLAKEVDLVAKMRRAATAIGNEL